MLPHSDLFGGFTVYDGVCTGAILIGSMVAAGGGLGGGGVFVPIYILILSFSTKNAAALSQATIFGGSLVNLAMNFRQRHPFRTHRPLTDFVTILIFEPMLLVGTVIGVLLNVIFPDALILILLVITLAYATIRTGKKGLQMWVQESTQLQNEQIYDLQNEKLRLCQRIKFLEESGATPITTKYSTQDDETQPLLSSSTTLAAKHATKLDHKQQQPQLNSDATMNAIPVPDINSGDSMHDSREETPELLMSDILDFDKNGNGDCGLAVNNKWIDIADACGIDIDSNRHRTRTKRIDGMADAHADADTEDAGTDAGTDTGTANSKSVAKVFPKEYMQQLLMRLQPYIEQEKQVLKPCIIMFVVWVIISVTSIAKASEISGVTKCSVYYWLIEFCSWPIMIVISAYFSYKAVHVFNEKKTLGWNPFTKPLLSASVPVSAHTNTNTNTNTIPDRNQNHNINDSGNGGEAETTRAETDTTETEAGAEAETAVAVNEIQMVGDIRWNLKKGMLYPLIATIAGMLGGLLGIGGGMIVSPLLMELGVIPRVAAATSALAVLITSSSATLQFLLIGGYLQLDYMFWFMAVGIVGTFIGQIVVDYGISKYGRVSLVVFAVTAIMGGAVILMGVDGILDGIHGHFDWTFTNAC